jgi:hypothetical protein
MRFAPSLARYVLVALVSSGAGAALTGAFAQQAPPEPAERASEDPLLARFIGAWEGEGEARGKSVTKEQRCSWVLDKKFVSIRSSSVSGDRFKSEAYLCFNPERRQYEMYEFNNGPYPVTTWTGQRDKDRLVLEGKVAGKTLRATYLWLDRNRMQILLSDEMGQTVKSYAGGVYRKSRSRDAEREL